MKRVVALLLVMLLMCSVLCACGGSSSYSSDYDSYDYDSDDSDYESGYDKYKSSFSNKYGTSSTKCAQAGCSNYIAPSGDTNCCVVHSNNCLECYCYIDGDAMYCMDCLTDAAYSGDSDYDSDYDSYDYDSYSSSNECYICGASAYSKYGSYYYCSSCLDLVKSFS